MIVVMSAHCTQEEVEAVQRHLSDRGLQGHLNPGVERSVIGVLGEIYPELQDELEFMSGVSDVFRVSKPYKLASREFVGHSTQVEIGKDKVVIGAGEFVVFAGPCAVESETQVLATARAVSAAGAKVMRGGAFKPRSSPYSFQGLGQEGLELLAAAGTELGMPVITELLSVRDVDAVASHADVLQIGTRNMQNFVLLAEAGKTGKAVMVKRGMGATIEEWLLAAEYILNEGNPNVILCERGIRTFETATRNTLDLNAIALVKRLSHLPVISDPSHGTGHWYLVRPMSLASIAVGADGLMIEVHPNPDHALSDGAQSLTPANFAELMDETRSLADAVGRPLAEVPQAVST